MDSNVYRFLILFLILNSILVTSRYLYVPNQTKKAGTANYPARKSLDICLCEIFLLINLIMIHYKIVRYYKSKLYDIILYTTINLIYKYIIFSCMEDFIRGGDKY